MARIQVLDKHTAELIAAGEVVERPASVMKELLENAIDAGATAITAEIKNGGVSYLSVSDNGCGIERDDVPTAFLRHATSKVRTERDLDAIGTLGFRGEALASIAAVARVELITAVKDALCGTHYEIEGGEETALEEVGCPVGTTIVIRDIFYNVPARMKFLKKDVGEANAVQGVVEKLALSHPEISVRFIRDGREVLVTPGTGDLKACLYTVLGRDFTGSLIPVSYELNGVTVSGYVSRPAASRANRTMQHFFVNGRYVKTRTAAAALEQAFKGSIMVGRFPSCVLFVSLAPSAVDANVHPAKIEVRFVSEKPVFDAVYYGVKQALEQGDSRKMTAVPAAGTAAAGRPGPDAAARGSLTGVNDAAGIPAGKSETAGRDEPPSEIKAAVTPPAEGHSKVSSTFQPTAVPAMTRSILHDAETFSWKTGKSDLAYRSSLERMADIAVEEPTATGKPPEKTSLTEAADAARTAETAAVPETVAAVDGDAVKETQTQWETPAAKPEIRYIGEIFRTYILAEMDGAVYCIDKHAAHERLLYNRLKTMENNEAQILLSPITVTLSAEEYAALCEAKDALTETGFEVEDFGGTTLLVRAVPAILTDCDSAATLQEIARGLLEGRRDLAVEKRDWIYHSTACRSAIKAGDISRPEELKWLAQQVLWNEEIRYCPHGRPVCVEWTKKELEKQFGRL